MFCHFDGQPVASQSERYQRAGMLLGQQAGLVHAVKSVEKHEEAAENVLASHFEQLGY